MLSTAEKIFSGISNLKSRYYKYLEKLCISNGIDISQLKNEGNKQNCLEMFFGGYNVLVGLKYFSNLKILKLVNQEIVSLRPLNELCNTLEEFWLVEGILCDLTGIESCKKLKKLYLYENKIEDGKLIGTLINLEVLWIENIIELKINGIQCTDSNLLSIDIWPSKIKVLDISCNNLHSSQSLLLLGRCKELENIYIDWNFENESLLKCSMELLEFLLYQFPSLKAINGEYINENQKILIKESAEKKLHTTMATVIQQNDILINGLNNIEKNFINIREKLCCYVLGLNKTRTNTSKREGRRHVANRLYEQCLYNLRNLKKIKNMAIEYEYLSYIFRKYFIYVNKLESTGKKKFCMLNESEEKILDNMLTHHFTLSKSHKVKILFSYKIGCDMELIEEKDIENIYCLGCPIKLGKSNLTWSLSLILQLIDKKELSKSENAENLEIFKNLARMFGNEEVKKSEIIIVPFMEYFKKKEEKYEKTFNENEFDDIDTEEIVHWSDLTLKILTILEIKVIDEYSVNMIRDYDIFEKEVTSQVKKFPNIGIDISINKKITNQDEADLSELIKEDKDKKEVSKIKKMTDAINQKIHWIGWSKEKYVNCQRIFTTRSFMNLLLNFGNRALFIDMIDFQSNVTILDLSFMKITKLDDLQKFNKLTYLDLSKNSLHTIKKLDDIETLKYLDISYNLISKIEDLPKSIMHFNGAGNNLSQIEFLEKLINLEYVDVSNNKLNSLKGLNNAINLVYLIASYNNITDKRELDIFENFQFMKFLDLVHNPICLIDGYKKKILMLNKNIDYLDREYIDKNYIKKNSNTQNGKLLTIELIENLDKNWSNCECLNLENKNIQTIALNLDTIQKMNKLKKLILSKNKLTSIGELLNLEKLVELNLNENLITSLVLVNTQTPISNLYLPHLEILKLSKNMMTSSTLGKLNLKYLKNLKEIDLSGNIIDRIDFSIFSNLPNLEKLCLQNNQIKTLVRRLLPKLSYLNLSSNKIKEIEQIQGPELVHLDISNNKIITCSSLKVISKMKKLSYLDCRGNPVTTRKVYIDFIKSQSKSLQILDTIEVSSLSTILGPIKTGKNCAIIEDNKKKVKESSHPTEYLVIKNRPEKEYREDFFFWEGNNFNLIKPKWKDLKPLRRERRTNNDDYFYGLDDKININEDILSLKGTKIG
ncbi:Leucine-rich repeat-containing protein [Strongyloides ratti]|uniref:Leucine-rich repeat-containing protein n=1 Tax=Strongyloides ratti TaxID=34506 RepID=A0A090MZD1_STRRB|nr:Leucine-rich repeat-containing protein [Strongyloides ratti]CEF68724.1 Leucine-rich repeat-containing protein [Strongyloides ratti]